MIRRFNIYSHRKLMLRNAKRMIILAVVAVILTLIIIVATLRIIISPTKILRKSALSLKILIIRRSLFVNEDSEIFSELRSYILNMVKQIIDTGRKPLLI